jgi:16S rRNA U516 pseudouridylate synthase RsuA-like enzyme
MAESVKEIVKSTIKEGEEKGVVNTCTKAGPSTSKIFRTRFGGWHFVYP